MIGRYNSFLIRCWHLDEREPRIKIEHIQSGEGVVVTTLAAALAWLDGRWNPQFSDGAVTSGQAPPSKDWQSTDSSSDYEDDEGSLPVPDGSS